MDGKRRTIQFVITEQPDGRFYGKVPGSDDGHGNEIDCLFTTPTEALESLLAQMAWSVNRKPTDSKPVTLGASPSLAASFVV